MVDLEGRVSAVVCQQPKAANRSAGSGPNRRCRCVGVRITAAAVWADL